MIRYKALHDVLPVIMEKLKVILPLAKGREFSIPLGVKVGWNYGTTEFEKDGSVKDNFFGLRKWTGEELREPPKRLTTVQAILNSRIGT